MTFRKGSIGSGRFVKEKMFEKKNVWRGTFRKGKLWEVGKFRREKYQ